MLNPGLSLVWLAILLFQVTEVAAQVTAVAPISIQRQGWVVTADSSQNGFGPERVTDNDPGTFWQTPANPDGPLPHWIQVDMGNQYVVAGVSYLPRQDGSTSGNIGSHTIGYSLDGQTWTTAAQGTWANDTTVKTSLFTVVIARYVRLTALTEASGTGKPFSSAAEIKVLTNPHSSLPRVNWQVSASSEEIAGQSFTAKNAIDDSPTTFWHSKYSSGTLALPVSFTIDQGVATIVGGLSYLPRPASSGGNGRIGQYTVQKSDDGNVWVDVVRGTWPDTAFQKFVEWAPITARYWRLVANTEAGNRGPWASASEINLLDGGVNLANFRISVDSEEVVAVNNSAVKAMDNDITTFWHTRYSGDNVPGYPHTYTIDMQTSLPVKALQYIPRQDGGKNGNIGQHKIDVSIDGTTWTTVATGAFADNDQAKLVNFQEQVCRYVRLTATSEAGSRGPWASAAEVSISYDSSFQAPAPQTLGQWGLTVNFPVVPVAVSMVANMNAVLAWSSYIPNGFGGSPGGQTITATYDGSTQLVSKALITNTGHDMFCPGISLDFDGRVVVTGGNNAERTSIFDPATSSWISGPNMVIPRGYQASATLSNGNVFTIGGSWSGGIMKKNGELYTTAQNQWALLSGADVTPSQTADAAGQYRSDNHHWLFAWRNGAVFQAGPSKAMNWYTMTGNGAVAAAGIRGDAPDQMCGCAVMYDAAAGKILGLGGSKDYTNSPAVNNAYIITIGAVGSQATTQRVADMNFKRIFQNAVVLPNGQTFVAGGQDFGSPFTDDSSIMYPEMYTPSTNKWTIMAPMAVPRNYHSVAILLPDATVLVGGGGLCDGCDYNHYDGQIFTPPYLFNSAGAKVTRPVINTVSASTVRVGATITVTTNMACNAFALVRMGSATHTVNTDQRRIALTPSLAAPNRYSITLPSDAGVTLPGYWMLFGMTSAGVPSVAKTVKVTL